MADTVFFAGAAGAIGRRLVPLLARAGHVVHGTTRSPGKAKSVEAAGGCPSASTRTMSRRWCAPLRRAKPGLASAPGREPHGEDDPLDLESADPHWRGTIAAVAVLETIILGTPPLDGTALRYGMFYGPGTG